MPRPVNARRVVEFIRNLAEELAQQEDAERTRQEGHRQTEPAIDPAQAERFRQVRQAQSRRRRVDVRIICATNRDPLAEVQAGRFREDLYYRLDVVRLHLPPLASRRDDIPLLAYYFLRKHAARIGKDVEDIDPEAMRVLSEYGYPGNIRELENIVERAVTLTHDRHLTTADLPPSLVDNSVQVVREVDGRLPTLAEREEDYIRYVLERCGQNRTKAAKILGIDRVSLWRKLKKHGMSEDEE